MVKKLHKKNRTLSGLTCLSVLLLLFGYMAWVMGLTNMLNTIMNTAHALLVNTVFYLMGMCVITGALGRILVQFGVVDLLQRLLAPVMRSLFNMPGVASLGIILTFLSDKPAIIALAKDKGFACYFKKYQHASLTCFGMGLLVIIFMMGQGFFLEPFIGFFGAVCGYVISTRLMQYFACKDFPNFRYEDAAVAPEADSQEVEEDEADRTPDNTFIRVLNCLLDGGKDGVNIGLAIIPGVLIISTLVMMLTFGGTIEGIDENGADIVVYTGKAFQGTQLLPWLASKLSFLFEWLFGFTAPELVSFPITALGTVGAALSLIPEFMAKNIIDGNAIAVCTAMGMCWSGYLSADAATLDSLGYRALVPRDFLSNFVGGIGAGVIAHWLYVGVTAVIAFMQPATLWSVEAEAWNDSAGESITVQLTARDDGSYVISDWWNVKGYDLQFTVSPGDSALQVTNAYAEKDGNYWFVHINENARPGESSYAAIYTSKEYTIFEGDNHAGRLYLFAFVYDKNKVLLNRCYYELTWGGMPRQTIEAEAQVEEDIRAEKERKEKEQKEEEEITKGEQ